MKGEGAPAMEIDAESGPKDNSDSNLKTPEIPRDSNQFKVLAHGQPAEGQPETKWIGTKASEPRTWKPFEAVESGGGSK
jgi:hypothetical protein